MSILLFNSFQNPIGILQKQAQSIPLTFMQFIVLGQQPKKNVSARNTNFILSFTSGDLWTHTLHNFFFTVKYIHKIYKCSHIVMMPWISFYYIANLGLRSYGMVSSFFIPLLDESRGYSVYRDPHVRPSHFWFPDNN